jgi:hypothetical protein
MLPKPSNKRFFLMHRMAAAYREGSHYFILLIITDGAISDMDHTKEAIILVCLAFSI